MTAKTWFITGASRGFGREWACAALERGASVAATAPDTSTLDDLIELFGDQVHVEQLGGICAFPGMGVYHASKWALEGISQSLAQEVARIAGA
jgi:NAD(P)-dependent dehydrogenase (short-subunit alcohol dehydrogenase family)